MLLLPIFFTLINFVFVVTMSQMQQIKPEKELSHRQQHLLQQYQDSLDQMPQLLQQKDTLDYLQQFVPKELMLEFLLKRKHPAETHLFLCNNSEQENSKIIEIKDEKKETEQQYILQHFLQDPTKTAKSVDKRHQPKDDTGFYANVDVLSVGKTTKTEYLLDKLNNFLQGDKMQQPLPQNVDKRQKQQKVFTNIREYLQQQNQIDEQHQQPPPLREVEDVVTQETVQQQLNAVESQEAQNVLRIRNEQQAQEGILELQYREAQQNSYNPPEQQVFQFYQPEQEKFVENHYSEAQERLLMELQHPKIKRNEYYQPDAQFMQKRRGGYEGVRQQQENVELQSVVQRLQKILESQSEQKRDQMWQNEYQSPVLQMRQIEKEVALQQLRNHIEKQIRASQPNKGQTQLNQSERFYQQQMMPNPLNLPATWNVLDIVQSQDLSPYPQLQPTGLPQMPMVNTQFWKYPNNNAAPITAVMQADSNTELQGSNFGGYSNVPVMNAQQTTAQVCPNYGACMSVSATATNNTTEEVEEGKETFLSKLTARFKVTTVSVAIAIIQKLLILDVWENVKASNVAIEEAERFIFSISANINVLSAFTDQVLFLRRRLEYFPVHFGEHYRILTQIRHKISRIGSLQHQTTRSIEDIKIDLVGRRTVALTYKQQQLTNGLINTIIFIMNLVQFFQEEESLTESEILLQGVVTAVFAALLIANAVIFFHLGGILVTFNEILDSITEQELQLESLTAHFHDIVDRVDFAFENFEYPPFGYPGPGSIKNINFSNSGALTGTVSGGGFSFGSRGMGSAPAMKPPMENKPGDIPSTTASSSSEMASSSPATTTVSSSPEMSSVATATPAVPVTTPATTSPEMSSVPVTTPATTSPEMSSVPVTTPATTSAGIPVPVTTPATPPISPPPPTTIAPPDVTVPSGSRIIRRPNTQNANLVNQLTRLKHVQLIIRN